MDIQELSERSGFPVRRLRHCLDQELVPGLEVNIAFNEAGRPRRFADDVGFAICCAAKLVELGLDREVIRTFINGMATVTFSDGKKTVLQAFFERRATGCAHLGDQMNVRFQIEVAGTEYDSKWVHPGNPAPLAVEYRPETTVTLDIGRIGERIFRWPKDR